MGLTVFSRSCEEKTASFWRAINASCREAVLTLLIIRTPCRRKFAFRHFCGFVSTRVYVYQNFGSCKWTDWVSQTRPISPSNCYESPWTHGTANKLVDLRELATSSTCAVFVEDSTGKLFSANRASRKIGVPRWNSPRLMHRARVIGRSYI